MTPKIPFLWIAILLTNMLLTSCISPGYHQRRIREIQENMVARDSEIVKINDPHSYLCHCGQLHREFK